MNKLIMAKGLPASGKTTWAKEEVEKSNGKTKRINKDDLRNMIDAGKWSKDNEKHILKVRDMLINSYLAHGFDVIVDDTNLHPKHEETLQKFAINHQVNFQVKDFTDVPLNECLRRNAQRANYVPEKTIKSMYNSFIKKNRSVAQYVAPPFDPDLPNCIIVDIDGTLAHIDDRSPYDYSQVLSDLVDESVRDIVQTYYYDGRDENSIATRVLIVSGRDDTCFADTHKWLRENDVPYDELFMRDPNKVDKKGNKLDDTIIKKEIFEKYIKPRFNVRFVLDDRDRVVKMWREQGLKVLQVAEGDF